MPSTVKWAALPQAYLAAGDPQALTRTWQDVMDAAVQLKSGANQVRWATAVREPALLGLGKVRRRPTTCSRR